MSIHISIITCQTIIKTAVEQRGILFFRDLNMRAKPQSDKSELDALYSFLQEMQGEKVSDNDLSMLKVIFL
jgi:hypothetical protein